MKKTAVKILAAAALISIAAAGIGTAHAYFTTYVEAAGSKPIHLGDTTTMEEKVSGTDKTVTITNSANSNKPVWVRAKAITGSKYESGLTYKADGWQLNTADGWYYYNAPAYDSPLLPGGDPATMYVSIKDWPKDEIDKDFNVVVVYETIPAIEDGETDGTIQYVTPTAADWSRTAE